MKDVVHCEGRTPQTRLWSGITAVVAQTEGAVEAMNIGEGGKGRSHEGGGPDAFMLSTLPTLSGYFISMMFECRFTKT